MTPVGIRMLLLLISKGFMQDTKKKPHAAHLNYMSLLLLLSAVGFKKNLVTAQAVGIPKCWFLFIF